MEIGKVKLENDEKAVKKTFGMALRFLGGRHCEARSNLIS